MPKRSIALLRVPPHTKNKDQSPTTNMSAAANQSSLGQSRGAGTTFGPDSGKSSDTATPAMSVGSATAAGHGDRTLTLQLLCGVILQELS